MSDVVFLGTGDKVTTTFHIYMMGVKVVSMGASGIVQKFVRWKKWFDVPGQKPCGTNVYSVLFGDTEIYVEEADLYWESKCAK